MYFGKFALISYLFSAILLGALFMIADIKNSDGTYMFKFSFNDKNGNPIATQAAVETLVGRNNVHIIPNPTFIFGDFYQGLDALGTIVFNTGTGGVIGDVLSPMMNALGGGSGAYLYVIFRAIFTFSTACLIINFLTGREL